MNDILIIELIIVFIMIAMAIISVKDVQMKSNQREAFTVIFIAVAVETLLSIMSELLYSTDEHNATAAVWLKTCEMIIAPACGVFFVSKIFRTRNHEQIIMIALCLANSAFCLYAMCDREMFHFSPNGLVRGNFYPAFAVIWVASIAYVILEVVRFSRYYQHRGSPVLKTIIALELISITLQMLGGKFRFELLGTAISLILLYLHFMNMLRDTDRLTALLNQGCWHNVTAQLRQDAVVIIFDLNDLKQINDQHGHQAGDRVIKAVAEIIKEVYSANGACFRIGGDEFAVLITKNLSKVDAMGSQLIQKLTAAREKEPLISRVSYGIMDFDPSYHNIYTVIEDADQQMYRFKNKSKQN